MSELKAGVIRTPHNEGMVFDRGSSRISVTEDETEFYLKSEADEELAKLNRQVKFLQTTHSSCNECNECADGMGRVFYEYLDKLKKEKAYLLKHTSKVINSQERVIHRQKYKRCLSMAKWCNERYILCDSLYELGKTRFYERWEKRWLELAKNFNPITQPHSSAKENKMAKNNELKKAATLAKKLIVDRDRILKSSDKIQKILLTTDLVIGGYKMVQKLRKQKNIFDELADVMNNRIALFQKVANKASEEK